jgi:soluble P-type ATPase
MKLEMPGGAVHVYDRLVLDFNGTLAVDGELAGGVAERLRELAGRFGEIVVLTADTFGTAARQLEPLPVTVQTLEHDEARSESSRKREYLAGQDARGAGRTVYIGNGANDAEAVEVAGLSIGVLGREGLHREVLLRADLFVTNPEDALDLLLHPQRLVAGLRR